MSEGTGDGRARSVVADTAGSSRTALALPRARTQAELARLRVYKLKGREGRIERIEKDGMTAVCTGLFKKETDLSLFTGMRVTSAGGAEGEISGSFGKTGKIKIRFKDGLAESDGPKSAVVLTFKKYAFDEDKGMHQ